MPGKSINLDARPYTMVGAIPASFSFYGHDRDVYTPIGQGNDPSFHDRRFVFSSGVVGRLKADVTVSQAKAGMEGVARSLATAYPEALAIDILQLTENLHRAYDFAAKTVLFLEPEADSFLISGTLITETPMEVVA